jgi:CheY-like chemotaxis protein
MSEQFHIPTNWTVLVVEDTEDRILWFRQRIPSTVFAKNADDAFRALIQQEFKIVFLDHDLHWMHADNSIFKGTGKEVARFIAGLSGNSNHPLSTRRRCGSNEEISPKC